MPANSSANVAGPVSMAAANRFSICPRCTFNMGTRNNASEPKRSAVKKIGGNSPTPIFEAIRFKPQIRFIPTSRTRSRGASDVDSPACVEVTDMLGRSASVAVFQERVERADRLRFRADWSSRPLLAVPCIQIEVYPAARFGDEALQEQGAEDRPGKRRARNV